MKCFNNSTVYIKTYIGIEAIKYWSKLYFNNGRKPLRKNKMKGWNSVLSPNQIKRSYIMELIVHHICVFNLGAGAHGPSTHYKSLQ